MCEWMQKRKSQSIYACCMSFIFGLCLCSLVVSLSLLEELLLIAMGIALNSTWGCVTSIASLIEFRRVMYES